MYVLHTKNVGKVVRGAVGFQRVLYVFWRSFAYAAIITVSFRCLKREIRVQLVLLVGREIVIIQSAALYVVLHLFGNVCLMSNAVK